MRWEIICENASLQFLSNVVGMKSLGEDLPDISERSFLTSIDKWKLVKIIASTALFVYEKDLLKKSLKNKCYQMPIWCDINLDRVEKDKNKTLLKMNLMIRVMAYLEIYTNILTNFIRYSFDAIIPSQPRVYNDTKKFCLRYFFNFNLSASIFNSGTATTVCWLLNKLYS